MGPSLSEEERAIYAWQLDLPGFGGETAQLALRGATALISRAGGMGGPLAFQLVAAGVGKVIIAHGGKLKLDDLNRQVLMAYAKVGRPRAESIAETLKRFNPLTQVEVIAENIHAQNVDALVGRSDIVFDCAPLFEERFLMNAACVAQKKPLVDCAMFGTDGQVMTILGGQTPCLRCLYPTPPEHWKRRFPVLGAVSAMVASIGALEGIKYLTGMPCSSLGKLIHVDTLSMSLRTIAIHRRDDCPCCAHYRENGTVIPNAKSSAKIE